VGLNNSKEAEVGIGIFKYFFTLQTFFELLAFSNSNALFVLAYFD
jgi:hypothetical protein